MVSVREKQVVATFSGKVMWGRPSPALVKACADGASREAWCDVRCVWRLTDERGYLPAYDTFRVNVY